MDRRDFLKNAGIGTANIAALANIQKQSVRNTSRSAGFLSKNTTKPNDVKVAIKPICANRIHQAAYEGSCRTGLLKDLAPQAEIDKGVKKYDEFVASLKTDLSPKAIALKPELIHFNDTEFDSQEDTVSKSDWKKIEADLPNTDLFFLTLRLNGIERYKKPIAIIQIGVTNVDPSAYMRSLGLEGYAPYDWDEFNYLISLLQARKAATKTRILSVRRRDFWPPAGVYSSCTPETLENKFGIGHQRISYEEFFKEMDRVSQNRSEQEKAKQMVDDLVNNAEIVHMQKEFIINDVNFYLTANNMMKKHGCNAFTIECFELCGSKNPWRRKFTPCLTHTLLKDNGYPSACESDLNAFSSMLLLMCLSGKSVYMGNTPFYKDEDLIHIQHNVPGMKMKGFDSPSLPYNLKNFATSGFGTGVRYDFSRDKGQEVTIARFNPMATKMLVTKGTIEKTVGLATSSCTHGVGLKVPDTMELFHKSADYGHHFTMVYGDYVQQLKDLGRMMNFQIDEV